MNNQSKNLFVEKYDRIKEFLNTESLDRTDDDLIDMRNVLEVLILCFLYLEFFLLRTIYKVLLFLQKFISTKSSEFIEMCRYLKIETFSEPAVLFS